MPAFKTAGCAAVVLRLIFFLTAAPTTPQTLEDRRFSENVDVRIVNVDVHAYDRRGRPLSGLQAGDFSLFVDGREVEILNFYEESRVRWARSTPQIVAFVDERSLRSADRNAVLPLLRDFVLERAAAEDARVMVAHSAVFLEVVQGFTSDLNEIDAAFDKLLAAGPALSESRTLERALHRDMEETLRMLRGGPEERRMGRSSLNGVLSSARGFADSVHRDTMQSVASLELLVRALGSTPGRKDLILVSDGLVLRPLEELVMSFQDQISLPEAARFSDPSADASRGLRMGTPSSMPGNDSNASDEAAAVGVDLPTSDGLIIGQDNDASVARLQQYLSRLSTLDNFDRLGALANSSRVSLHTLRPPTRDAAGSALGRNANELQRPLSDVLAAPRHLAEATAGLSLLSGDDIEGFLDRTTVAKAHYSLGFASQSAAGLQRLELRSDKASRLRYRQSYLERSDSQRFLDRTRAALEASWIDNPHRLKIEVESIRPLDEGAWEATLVLTMPAESIRLSEVFGRLTADCAAAVVTRDDDRRASRANLVDVGVQLDLRSENHDRQRELAVRLPVTLSGGRQPVAIGFFERSAERSSFIRVEVDPNAEASQPHDGL